MKRILQEVNIIRPFVIFLLVLMHSFAIFSGGDGWPKPDGVEQIDLYKWFSWFITGFRIETIAFIAGYVFSYQSNVLGRKYTIWGIIKKKFVRLIIPCWFFGIIYVLCFTRTEPIMQNLADVINGIGHLWFLTMLFWCFLLLVIIDRLQTGKKARWIIFLLLMIVSCVPIPTQLPLLGLRRVPHFIFYAYLGYLLFLYKDNVFKVLKNKPWLFLVLYVVSVVLSNAVLPQMRNQGNTLIIKACIYAMLKISQLLSALSGIIFVYLIVIKFLKKKGEQYTVPSYINAANNMCYGVYVFHQFILIYLYYYTSIPSMVNSYILPILSFIIVLSLSGLLTAMFTKFRFGRFLIG